MGNRLFSCLSSPPPPPSSSSVLIILLSAPPTGGPLLERRSAPLCAAELMMEHPGHFVLDIDSICISSSGAAALPHASAAHPRRMAPIPADQSLLPHHMYALIPMHRLHSRLSPAEITSLRHLRESVACAKTKTKSRSRKVSPVPPPLIHGDDGGCDDDHEDTSSSPSTISTHRSVLPVCIASSFKYSTPAATNPFRLSSLCSEVVCNEPKSIARRAWCPTLDPIAEQL